MLRITIDLRFDSIRPEHIEPAFRALLARARGEIDGIAIGERGAGERCYEDTLGALESAIEPLETAMAVVEHLGRVASTPELRAAHEAVQPEVSAFLAGIPLHEGLWRALQAFAATDRAGARCEPEASERQEGPSHALSGARRRFLQKTMGDFRRRGAELDGPGRRRLVAIDGELAKLMSRYSRNLVEARATFELVVRDRELLGGLPESELAAARDDAIARGVDGYRLSLHASSYLPAITYLDDPRLRETLWRSNHARGTADGADNRVLIPRILELRREKARLLGFGSFADLVLEERMAGSGAAARAFVQALCERTAPFFSNEVHSLQSFRERLEGEGAPAIQPWDLAYFAEKQRRALFGLDEEELRAYFPLDRVLAGLFELAHRLYGIRIEERSGVRSWHPSVRGHSIRDGNGSLLCHFYTDLHLRDGKAGGAWMDGFIVGEHSADRRAPHLGLICANLRPPSAGRPALLRHAEVSMLFHEFGHLLHLALSRPEVRSLGGTRVARDFVELPSQIMENWCWEREALDLFAGHWESGAPIPEPLFQKMIGARTFRAATTMMEQLGLSEVDLALHTDYDAAKDGDATTYARHILQRYTPAPLPAMSARIASFAHIFGDGGHYAAGYYSYKWAEVLDADAFSRFREEGLFNPAVGRAFRDEILAKGGSADPALLFRAFRGRAPSLDPLLASSSLLADGPTS